MASEAGRASNSNSVLMQRLGGANRVAAELWENQDRVVQLQPQHPEPERKHTGQWVIPTKSGMLAAGNTVDEPAAKLNALRISRRCSVVKSVGTERDRLIPPSRAFLCPTANHIWWHPLLSTTRPGKA